MILQEAEQSNICLPTMKSNKAKRKWLKKKKPIWRSLLRKRGDSDGKEKSADAARRPPSRL